MDANKWLSTITMAGIIGLFVLNADKAASLISGIADASTSYVKTVQGR